MAQVGDYSMLLSPVRVGSFELRNRVVTTAHSIYQPWAPIPGSQVQYVEYCRRRAAGGVAMLICQPIIVQPYGDWPASMSDRLVELADAIKTEGAVAVLQIVNFGAQIGSAVLLGGQPMWSLNGAKDEFGEASHKMTTDEVGLMVEAYAQTARVVAEAGMDGVELHGAHGYLLNQSYAPWGNGRDDEWGEPLAFSRAVISAVRQAMGPDKLLGYRTTAADLLRPDEGHQDEGELFDIANRIVDTGDVDFLDFSIGIKAPAYSQPAVASYRYPADFDIPLAARLRKAIDARVPLIGVGGVTRPENAEAALQRGDCDLVGMTRANIADPELVNKLKRGDDARVRQCVRANECVDRRVDGKVVACFHNPDMGREFTQIAIRPAARARHVVIVGAGPAGLKAAEAVIRHGHTATVVDAEDEPGGRLRWVRGTAASSLYGSVQWLVNEIEVGGGDLRLGTRVDLDDVRDLRPDAVILATGAEPATATAFEGSDGPGAVTVDQALALELPPRRAIVLDRMGSNEAALVGEVLIGRGTEVVFVTPYERLHPTAGYTHRLDLRDIFRRSPLATTYSDADVRRYHDGVVTIIDHDGLVLDEVEADAVVVGTHPAPNTSLHADATGLGVPVRIIGDALAARGALVAMREAEDTIVALWPQNGER